MRWLRSILILAAITCCIGGPLASEASACPSCQTATENAKDKNLPQAMMYSILFMLAVPACIFGGLGFGLYKISRREKDVVAELEGHGEV